MPSPEMQVVLDGDVCRLSGVLDFASAPSVLAQVNKMVHGSSQLTIDMQGIVSSNSAGLALMIEWLAEAKRAGHRIQFNHVPESLKQLSVVCQVHSLI